MTDLITPSGPVATTQGATVYVKRYGDWSRFVWGGECVYIQDITDERGGINITTRANALEGGLQRDGVLVDPPGNVTTTLSMKRLRGDKLKTLLSRCFWDFDKRTQCNDFDDHTAWTEIERVYRAKVGTRTTTPGTSISEANAEDMVNFDVTALEDCDLYRLHIAERTAITAGVFEIQCVDLCHGERCVNCGNPETDAVLVAGGIDDGGGVSPWILVNEDGGAVDSWTGIDITEWDTFNVDGITCLGTWGAAVSTGAAAALYSRDRFTNRVVITSTDMTAHPPRCIDASSQNFVVIGGSGGYIFISRDGLATIETALAGTVTTEHLTEIAIAPSNSLVVYAASYADDVILKTENGGDTWFQVAVTGTAHGIFSLCIHPDDANMVLVGTDDGEIFQTTDGGATWVEQAEVPGLVTVADTVIRDIDTVGCGVWFAAISDSSDVFRVYVNYEDGASGAWEYFNPLDGETYDLTMEPLAVAAVSPNRCVAVGGDNATADLVALLA